MRGPNPSLAQSLHVCVQNVNNLICFMGKDARRFGCGNSMPAWMAAASAMTATMHIVLTGGEKAGDHCGDGDEGLGVNVEVVGEDVPVQHSIDDGENGADEHDEEN